jgi:hypothetical protein
MRQRLAAVTLAFALGAAACSSSDSDAIGDSDTTDRGNDSSDGAASGSGETSADTTDDQANDRAATPVPTDWPRPDVPTGALSDELDLALGEAVISASVGIPAATLTTIAESGDPRAAWVVVDLLQFLRGSPTADRLVGVYAKLTGAGLDPFAPWTAASNQMISWDIPAPPNYVDYKRALYLLAEPKWEPFFEAGADVDWRHVGWGGVLIDDRPLGDPNRCVGSCIPALDDPAVTDADGGSWYPDERLVFGVVVNDAARAYPRNIMEIHEMVNDDLGGRRIGVPYCTLCGSAQAYYTDNVPAADDGTAFAPVLRTTGLLIRSNKMMFDLETFSLIDTFTGRASTGPLAAASVELEQVSIVTTTWADWKDAHPDTTIVAEDGGIGRTYSLDPLGSRDANGPIFPVGDVDPRLPVQEQVLGLTLDDGSFVGVHVADAVAALNAGDEITIGNITLVLDGGGLRGQNEDGSDVGAHQAFWFAWSQFHPETKVWPADFS